MIPFNLPEVSMFLSQYMEIVDAQNEAGASVGFLIGLGKKFFSSGVTIVDVVATCVSDAHEGPGIAKLWCVDLMHTKGQE